MIVSLFRRCRSCFAVLLLLLLAAASCTKVAPLYSLKTPANSPDTTRDIRKMLDSMPGSGLFAQAFNRAGLSGKLDPAGFYTLFVPSDSAMKAAGLTGDVINTLSPDSLSYWLSYHITYGAVSDTTLTNAVVSLQQNCLLESLYYSPLGAVTPGYSSYRHSLFVKEYGGILNINGWAVNGGERPVAASNGYIYPIHILLRPPSGTIWDILQSRPELSYYLAAIRIMDSIYVPISQYDQPAYTDSAVFGQLRFDQVDGAQPVSVSPVHATVFAPTNTAFIQAGLPDIDSIRNYIIGSMRTDTLRYDPNNPSNNVFNTIPGSGNQILPDGGANAVNNYLPFDSVLKMQYLYNVHQQSMTGQSPDLSFSNSLCYSDLTGSPSINNGVLNVCTLNAPLQKAAFITPYTLRFSSGAGAQLTIQWNAAGTGNAVIPQDANQLERARNFWALNGVIYESDRLFLSK
jgi:uncharacterized surface protein with fasciclin (FAS1) repeats